MPPVPKPRPRQTTYLRAWRDSKGLSQEAAAALIGTDRSTVSRVERGKSPYDQLFLEGAAKAYGCEPHDLIMRHPADRSYDLMNPASGARELLVLLLQLTPAQIKQMTTIVRSFLEAS